jgi:superfamily II DNA helicase RecQ
MKTIPATPAVWRPAEHNAQLIYISLEMALSDRFGRPWMDAKFCGRVNALIVDEAHCIDEWGEKSRPMYWELHRLRSFTGQGVPFVACTATCATNTICGPNCASGLLAVEKKPMKWEMRLVTSRVRVVNI